MARSYAQIMTAIWKKNYEFVRLSFAAQRAYLMLASQSDISAAGTLPVVLQRWATLAKDTSTEDVSAALAELEAENFIVVDWDTQELLVRSFVKWDGGYNNQKRRPVILDAAAEVTSPRLRVALAAEFDKLGLPTDSLGIGGRVPENAPKVDSVQDSLFSQVDRPCQDQPQNIQNDRVVVTSVGSSPQPLNRNPQHASRAVAPTENQRAQELAKTYTDVVKLSNFLAVLGVVKKAINAGDYSDDDIQSALSRLAEDRRTISTESLRIEIEGPPKRRLHAAPNTDDNIAAFLGNTGTENATVLQLPRGRS